MHHNSHITRWWPGVSLFIVVPFMSLSWPQRAVANPPLINDTEITRAVEARLEADEGVSPHLLDIVTENGVVTVTGIVDHLLAKDRTLDIVGSTKGVLSIVNRLTVRPMARSDDEIGKDVHDALAGDPVLGSYELDASVRQGVVMLRGKVGSWFERELAGRVVKGILGIKDVKNEIGFEYDSERPDNEIKADIQYRLRWDPWLNRDSIQVQVGNGSVLLTGTVRSLDEKNRAYADAWVAGVEHVEHDSLKVDWNHEPKTRRKGFCDSVSTDEIKRAVQRALMHDPRVSSHNTEVTLEDSMAVLRGTVINRQARRAAEQTAKNTACVRRVENLLKVRSKVRHNDREIVVKIRQALERNPYLAGADINVSASGGVVYLGGSVDSRLQKAVSEEVASRVNGVKDVKSKLFTLQSDPKKDWEIRDDIESELFWSPLMDHGRITVSVEDGIATLTGQVTSHLERSLAVERARQAGARMVRDKLSVTEEK